MSFTKWSALALAAIATLGFASAAFAAASANDDEPIALDVIHTKRKSYEGRLIERNRPGEYLILVDGKPQEIDREDVTERDFVRDRLQAFLEHRKPDLSVDEEWELVERAVAERLPRLARVQAYHVLVRDPFHRPAHEFLGHELRRDEWRWTLDDDEYPRDELEALIADWSDRFVLRSTHWTVETNAGIKAAVDTLFDLERLYVQWHVRLGASLEATEDVYRPDTYGMVVHVFRSPADDAFKSMRLSGRDAHYDASAETTTQYGNQNVVRTFMGGDEGRPHRLFDLATRQLMYSTLVLGKSKTSLPSDSYSHFASWTEWGVGYWFQAHLSGPAGYAQWKDELRVDPNLAALALTPARGGPLKTVREEVTNLIGLQTVEFHREDDVALHRAKAQTFGAFLLEEAPPTFRGNKQRGDGRSGFLHYLREVYGTARAHSSDAMDEGLGEVDVETLAEPWREWLRGFLR